MTDQLTDEALEKRAEELNAEYRTFIDGLQRQWTAKNRVRSNRTYETMYPREREEVHQRIEQWGRYITPIAESWWRVRGYGCIWPDDNNEPMKLYKLDESIPAPAAGTNT